MSLSVYPSCTHSHIRCHDVYVWLKKKSVIILLPFCHHHASGAEHHHCGHQTHHDGPHLAAHRQKASATRPSCGVVAAEPIRTRLIDMHTLSKRIARRCDITSAVGQSPHFLLRLCSLGKLLVSCHPCCGTCLSARAIQTWLLFGGYPIWRAATLLGRTRTGACRSWTNGGSPVSLFLSAPCLLCGSCGSDTSCNTTQRSPRWWKPIKKKNSAFRFAIRPHGSFSSVVMQDSAPLHFKWHQASTCTILQTGRVLLFLNRELSAAAPPQQSVAQGDF